MTAPTPDIGRVLVDPRFRERRIAVRRQAGRRRLKRLLVLVVVAAVALATVVVLRSPVLDVDAVTVEGTRHTDAELIREATGIGVGAPLLLADLGAAEDAVEALPWVADATVTRDLPSDVVVTVDERVPAALVAAGPARLLVDGSGRVLESGRTDAPPPGAAGFVSVVVRAEEVPAPGGVIERRLHTAVGLASRLRQDPPGAVAAVRVQPTLRLELADGGIVDLGDATGLDAKVEAFRTAFARIDLTCLDTLDLRVPTHPVLTRRDACS